MRFTLFGRLLALALVSTSLATPPILQRAEPDVAIAEPQLDGGASTEKVNSAGAPTDGGSDKSTTFNGQKVPAILEISGAKVDDTIGTGYW